MPTDAPTAGIPEPTANLDESFAALDAVNAAPEAGANPSAPAASAPEPGAPPADTKLPEDAGSKDQKPPDDTTTTTATPDDKKAAKGKEEFKTPKELRTAYESLKKRTAEMEGELTKLKTAKPPEVKPADPREHPDFKAALERAEKAETRLRELDDEIRFVDYEKSSEFKEKYEQPYQQLAQSTIKAGMDMSGVDAEGNPRKVTDREVWEIIVNPNADDALAAAERLYGNPTKAARLALMRDQIQQSWERMQNAKLEFKSKGAERLKAEQAKIEQQTRAEREQFEKLNADTVTRFPHYFAPIDGDSKGNELLTKGFTMVDKAFDPKAELTPEQRIKLHSSIRNRAAGFDRLAYRYKSLESKLAEAEKQIEAFKKSTPGNGDVRGAASKSDSSTWEADLDKLAQ